MVEREEGAGEVEEGGPEPVNGEGELGGWRGGGGEAKRPGDL